jgi:hypothetical protein
MQVSGLGEGKDFKLWPGGGRAWNWIETDTHHVPGILPSDVEELLEHGAEVVVLSRGMLLRLQIARETMALLEDRGVRVRIAETAAAVELYNELAGRNVIPVPQNITLGELVWMNTCAIPRTRASTRITRCSCSARIIAGT